MIICDLDNTLYSPEYTVKTSTLVSTKEKFGLCILSSNTREHIEKHWPTGLDLNRETAMPLNGFEGVEVYFAKSLEKTFSEVWNEVYGSSFTIQEKSPILQFKIDDLDESWNSSYRTRACNKLNELVPSLKFVPAGNRSIDCTLHAHTKGAKIKEIVNKVGTVIYIGDQLRYGNDSTVAAVPGVLCVETDSPATTERILERLCKPILKL